MIPMQLLTLNFEPKADYVVYMDYVVYKMCALSALWYIEKTKRLVYRMYMMTGVNFNISTCNHFRTSSCSMSKLWKRSVHVLAFPYEVNFFLLNFLFNKCMPYEYALHQQNTFGSNLFSGGTECENVVYTLPSHIYSVSLEFFHLLWP